MADNFWSGLNKGIGGTIDWFSDNRWDMDGMGANPASTPAENPGFTWKDAAKGFTDSFFGDSSVPSGGSTAAGKSFLEGYKPTSQSSVTQSEFGGLQGTIGDDIAFWKEPNIILQDHPPVPENPGGGSVEGPSTSDKLKNAALDVGKAWLISMVCDIRVKTDISPLETTEVNDDLAEVAFFVKGLRGCS